MVNVNEATGIAYGYIAANSLHSDVVQTLQSNGTDVFYKEAWEDFIKGKQSEYDEQMEQRRQGCEDDGGVFYESNYDAFDPEEYRDEFNNSYQQDEPIHEGEYEGVKYRTSWLGGALNVWVFESPHIALTRPCSPCVPNAGDLDNVSSGDYQCYDVPPNWRVKS